MSISNQSSPGSDDRQRPEDTGSDRKDPKRRETIAMLVAGLAIIAIAGIIVMALSWVGDGSSFTDTFGEPWRADRSGEAAKDSSKAREQRGSPSAQSTGSAPSASAGSKGTVDWPAAAADVRRIDVSFKLDPRLTKGIHLGERWVSPQTYMRSAGEDGLVVEARARSLDANGKPVSVGPVWITADPGILEVSPSRGDEVAIHVRRAGETTLTIDSGGTSKKLSVAATEEKSGILQVAIKQ